MGKLSAAVFSFVFSFLATILFVVFMLDAFGPGQIALAHRFINLWPPGFMLAVWWFTFLGLRRHTSRRKPTPPANTLKRAAIIFISLLIAAAGIGSILIMHLGCVSLNQRIEAFRARFSCVQARQIKKACEALLANAGKNDFHKLITPSTADSKEAYSLNAIVPELLRKGSAASLPLDPKVRSRLASTYSEMFEENLNIQKWRRPMFSKETSVNGLLDGWDRPFEFSEPTQSNSAPTIRSLGCDGVISSDDIGVDFLPEMDQDLAAFEFYDATPINRSPIARIFTLIYGRKWLSANENILHRE
jgi:hypothetical protein